MTQKQAAKLNSSSIPFTRPGRSTAPTDPSADGLPDCLTRAPDAPPSAPPPAPSSPPQEEPPADRGKEQDPTEARASEEEEEEEEEKGATYHLPLPA